MIPMELGHTSNCILFPAMLFESIGPLNMNNELENKIPLNIWNGIERGSYLCIAQELPPSNEDTRRWVALYANYKLPRTPMSLASLFGFLKTTLDFKYCIVDFEVKVKTLEISDGISEKELENVSFHGGDSIDAMRSFLDERNVLLLSFLPEWKCDFPL